MLEGQVEYRLSGIPIISGQSRCRGIYQYRKTRFECQKRGQEGTSLL